ncbi:MAG: N-acetylmuramoyl-L-alanine amidase [Saprospiraceae bacterium]|nr:N-acetylmuramoyl-L-alanine amidase [Saprospiraceae bacterium]
MLRILCTIGLFLCFLLPLHADGSRYYQVPALPGDGVYSLLRRYKLDDFNCNHEEFYRLNTIDRNTGLIVGKYYSLPILLYEFNGKTIRSSIGITDYPLAKEIQTYNETMLGDGLRKDSFKESKVLWVPYHLLNCPEEVKRSDPKEEPIDNPESVEMENGLNLAATEGGSRRFPIFGRENEYVPLLSTKMKGRVYYIVTGHGGPDPGAMGTKSGHTLCEDEYAYDVGLRLARNLIANGATVYVIVRDPNDGIRSGEFLDCDYDEVIWGNKPIYRQQLARLKQRSAAINKLYEKHRAQGVKEQYAIMIHVDSRSQSTQTDLFFYHHPNSASGKALANQLHTLMKRKYNKYRQSGEYHGTVSTRDLHMLRETKPTSVYIELANIRNAFDQQRIVLESNRQALANWLYEGLED